ncbi:unnamed protein product [Mytilus edulis]|uniref:Uncharacterized protein n=1 Tax=Mytilus edulis TaxID=6550 RepID=A0A8S3SHW3_MYTED|nr:unnamed protein product [Mytilus edulis]
MYASVVIGYIWKKKPCKVQKQAGRCNLISYMGQQRRSNWTKPSSTEGPVGYGLTHPFCTDCSGCNSALFNCGEIKIEYISVEYARDVEIQSTIGNTTQEAILHMKQFVVTLIQTLQMYESLISGLHDMVLPALTDRLYVKNVHLYVQHLVQTCQNVIWISMTAVTGDKGFPQIQLWNRLIKEMLRNKFSKIGFIDFFPISNSTKAHSDNVRLTAALYKLLTSFLYYICIHKSFKIVFVLFKCALVSLLYNMSKIP